MDQNIIFSLIDKFQQSQLTKLEVQDGDFSVKLEHAAVQQPVADSTAVEQTPHSTAAEKAEIDDKSNLVPVKAPLVGVFYAAPSPDAAPYVRIGERVEAGQVLCLVEAMKMMNELKAPVDGRIRAIHGINGELVEFDQTLFEVEPC